MCIMKIRARENTRAYLFSLKGNLKMKKHNVIRKMTFSAMFIALAFVLPFLTANIPEIGQALCPMHIPVILCGFICGWQYGLAVGYVSPLMRSFIMHAPPVMSAIPMAFELAAYGAIAGLMYKLLPKKAPFMYVDLLVSMIAGRLVWGTVKFFMAGLDVSAFGLSAFWAGAVMGSIPGIIVQIVLIPAIVYALSRAGLMLNGAPVKDGAEGRKVAKTA